MEETLEAKEVGELKENTSIENFLNDFRTSSAYQSSFEKFFIGKNLTPDVTEQEKIVAFEASRLAEDTLDYFTNTSTISKIEINNPDIKECIKDYSDFVKYSEEIARKEVQSPDQIVRHDEYRRQLHNKAGQALIDAKIAYSTNFGRKIISSIVKINKLI